MYIVYVYCICISYSFTRKRDSVPLTKIIRTPLDSKYRINILQRIYLRVIFMYYIYVIHLLYSIQYTVSVYSIQNTHICIYSLKPQNRARAAQLTQIPVYRCHITRIIGTRGLFTTLSIIKVKQLHTVCSRYSQLCQ